ncbi:unnamed protein product [Echinostoma caproni]|uniref:SF3 helicase domain-containing protein n=1 Tax=Echinostoma caproni TaxID=27848 RepID=A0A183A1Q7_9TREM|nr:unnamed protein product [Echinostoma caproni]
MSSPVFDNTVILPTPSYSTPNVLPHPSEIPSPDLFEDDSPPCSAQRMDERIANAFGQDWSPPATPRKQYAPTWYNRDQQTIPRGPSPNFTIHTRINVLWADHGDHYHFVFKCHPNNKRRTITRIIQAGNLDTNQSMSIFSTCQPVINWEKFAAYLVRHGRNYIYCIGGELQHLATDARSTTRAEQDCATLLRNDRAQGQKFTNLKRKARVDLIRELVETYDARTLAELKDALSYDDRLNLYAEHGPSWKETAELTCEAYVERLRKDQETTSLHEYIARNNHNRTCQKPTSTTAGCQWLDQLLAVNHIDKNRFLTQVTNIMNKKEQRINAFVIQGPTTTGKSLMLNLLTENYIYGTVQRSGDHSQFYLMNLLNKAVALMEEPRITPLTVNDFKELLGGRQFDIHVKHQPDARLRRLPVLISTNTDICQYLQSEDAKAIKARYNDIEHLLNNEHYLPTLNKLKDVYFIWTMVQNALNIQNRERTFIELANDYYQHFYNLDTGQPRAPLPDLEEREYFISQIYKAQEKRKQLSRKKLPTKTTQREATPKAPVIPLPEQPKIVLDTGEHLQEPMAKRPALDTDMPEDGKGGTSANPGALQHVHNLFKIHYYKFDITLTRKQHLTIAQYKPADTAITQFYITCIPYQFFEFWAINNDGTAYRDPYDSIQNSFDYCHYDSGHIRFSHFVPLQHSLTGTTQQDVPALNTTPYAYFSQDNLGILTKITSPNAIDMSTMQNQAVKIPSNTYWTKTTDEGLLALDETKTFQGGQTIQYNFKFNTPPWPKLKQTIPRYDANTLVYLPLAQTTDAPNGKFSGGWQYSFTESASTSGSVAYIPERDLPFLFIYIPWIEQVNEKETIARLYAHILMETQFNMTLWSVPDGAAKLNPNCHRKNQMTYTTHAVTSKDMYHQAYQFH